MNHLSCSGISRKGVQALSRLATDRATGGRVLVQLGAIDTDARSCGGGSSESAVAFAGDGRLEAARANVDGTLVGRVPVRGSGGLIGQR